MKKILSFMFMLLVVLSLTACKEDGYKEPKDDTTFEEWLDKNVNSLDSDKIDEMVKFEEVDPGKIADLEIKPISVTIVGGGELEMDEISGTAWQDDTVIYGHAGIDGEEAVVSLDLDDIVEMLEKQMPEDFQQTKPSELINDILAKTGLDMDLDDLLDLVEIKADYFEEKEDGVWEFKIESIGEIVEKVAAEVNPDAKVDGDEIVEMIQEPFKELSVELTYDNGKVRDIKIACEIDFEEKDGSYSQTVQAEGYYLVAFGYGPEGVNSLTVESESTMEMTLAYGSKSETQEFTYSLKSTLAEDESSLEMNFEYVDMMSMSANFVANEEKIEGKFEMVASEDLTDGDEVNATLEVNIELEESWVTEGTISVDINVGDENGTIEVTLVGGEDVDVPEYDEDEVMDLMDLMTGSMGGQVYPEYNPQYK